MDDCCANSGELRNMMEEVAEKAAKRAADLTSANLKLQMYEMQQRINEEFEAKLREYFGMSAQDHAIEHSKMRRVVESIDSIKGDFFKKIAVFLLTFGLLGIGAATSGFDVLHSKAVTREESKIHKGPKSDNIEEQ